MLPGITRDPMCSRSKRNQNKSRARTCPAFQAEVFLRLFRSANNQTGFADKFRSHIPERSPITLMYGNLASHWLADPLKRSSITRESTSPDWL